MVDHREAILAFVREKGPSLPAALARHMKMELLFASAHLAELTENKKLKSTWMKIGGSPLYYLPGQEGLLENFSENLGEKDKRAYALLRQEKLVREEDLDPLSRVSIKNLRDFAVPVVVTNEGKQEQYWKFHSLSNDEVQQILKSRFEPEQKEPLKQEKSTEEKSKQKTEQKKDLKKEEQRPLTVDEPIKEPAHDEVKEKPAQKKEKREKQKNVDAFAAEVSAFFDKHKIVVREQTILKKDAEIDYIIQIPSVFGNLEYYCKAKNKKKLSDSDISGAYVAGQMKKLPVILLTSAEPSKKAMEVLSSLKGIVLHRLE